VLVELGLVEQRYQEVLEVLAGGSVTDVARRYGVARQTLHGWLRRYASDGLVGLVGVVDLPAAIMDVAAHLPRCVCPLQVSTKMGSGRCPA
jgi:transposase-like protein